MRCLRLASQSWATEELKYAALPDKRLNQRLIKIVENLAQQPHASIPQASGDWATTLIHL